MLSIVLGQGTKSRWNFAGVRVEVGREHSSVSDGVVTAPTEHEVTDGHNPVMPFNSVFLWEDLQLPVQVESTACQDGLALTPSRTAAHSATRRHEECRLQRQS